jgi:SP family sugar:H+ symporter-like MFS transporter
MKGIHMSEHVSTANEPSIFDDDDKPQGRGVIRIASVAALAGLLFGYDSAVINGAVKAIQNDFNINDAAIGFAVASALLGAAGGAMSAGRIADRFGRIFVMKVAAVLFFVSAVGCGLAPEVWSLIFFRVLGGVGVGVASVVAPAYIAEVSPTRIRGRLGSLQQLAIVLGIFLSLLVDSVLAALAGGSGQELWLGLAAWRWMFIVMVIPAVVYWGLARTIPESPRYLVASHRIPEARKVLTALLGEKNLEITIGRIQSSLGVQSRPSWRDLRMPSGRLWPIVWIGLGLSVLQQAVGINVIFYYSNVLWEAVGFNESDAFVISVFTSVVNIGTTVIAIALVDRVGRKPLLVTGSIGMAATLGTLAVVFGTATMTGGEPHLEGAAGPVALIAANLFVVFFGMSWGPVVWVLLGEMFPNRMRAAALSFAAAGQWAANWLITISFPVLKSYSLGFAYGIYALFAVLSMIFIVFAVRETKGVDLEDMEAVSARPSH